MCFQLVAIDLVQDEVVGGHFVGLEFEQEQVLAFLPEHCYFKVDTLEGVLFNVEPEHVVVGQPVNVVVVYFTAHLVHDHLLVILHLFDLELVMLLLFDGQLEYLQVWVLKLAQGLVPVLTQTGVLESHLVHGIVVCIQPELSLKASPRVHELVVEHRAVDDHGHVVLLLLEVVDVIHVLALAQADALQPVHQRIPLLDHAVDQLDHDRVRVYVFEQFDQQLIRIFKDQVEQHDQFVEFVTAVLLPNDLFDLVDY